jgi:2-phosphoglycerate kinase
MSFTAEGPSKPVVLIGGAPGTGKSTLAGHLSTRFNFDHRIGTGFIRAVLQSEVSRADEPDLFSMTFQAPDPVVNLERQARRLQPAVTACVERARREGTSLIVEGSHLIPSLYAGSDLAPYLVLAAPDSEDHMTRLTGPTHSNRTISEQEWCNVRKLDDYYCGEARRLDVPVMVYEDLDAVVELIALES